MAGLRAILSPQPVENGTRGRRIGLIVGCVYAATAVGLYWPVLATSFLADDYAYLDAIRTATGPAVVVQPLAERYFRPVVVLVYYLNYHLAGLTPWPYHLSVLAVHVAAACLVYRLARRVWPDDRPWGPALAGLLFVAFAGHSEAVTWIGGMADPLVTAFVLAALLLVLRWMEEGRAAWLVGSWAAFALALLSKESAVIYPALALVCGELLRPAGPLRQAIGRYAAAMSVPILLIAAILVVRTLVLGFPMVSLAGLATNADPVTAARAFALRAVLPLGDLLLVTFRQRLDLWVLMPLILYAVAVASPRQRLALGGAAGGLALALAPVLPLTISLHTSESERLVYMATAFSAIFVLLWLQVVLRRQAAVAVVAAALVAVHGYALQQSNRHWQEAAAITRSTLDSFADIIRRDGRPGVPVFVLNVPDDVGGAYVFRRGFHDALRVTAPDQLAAMAHTGVLCVYRISDLAQPVRVTVAGPRTLVVDTGGSLLGAPAPPSRYLRFESWAEQRFAASFTPDADGSLVVYFTPQQTAVVGRLPFDAAAPGPAAGGVAPSPAWYRQAVWPVSDGGEDDDGRDGRGGRVGGGGRTGRAGVRD